MVSAEKRRRQLAAEKERRRMARHEAARRRTRIRNAVLAAVLVVAVASTAVWASVAAFGGGEERRDDAADATPTPSRGPDPCEKPAPGKPNGKQWDKEPKMSIDTEADHTMVLETTCGDITINLDARDAPRTVNSFSFLAGQKYFDHTACHRMTEGGLFVLQCGDPTGTGQGTPGYSIPDENLKDKRVADGVYPAGTVAMANTYNAQTGQGRDSGGSQFFLVYEDSPLPADYTPFGTVAEGKAGMDVLKKIADAGVYPAPEIQATAPNATVVINKATVTAG
ncbi:peptidylprolyl isomerase [Streptomyces durbertensis]|uniref:Peptidylprolyl isomerase n=1 Tax=Streptomyces durbertensis TaxID=2448886 RepID=A0ABR6EG21_9ACTN|nr:peptidylprolyl isomerase [Streptomyces durbertensis]MBB1244285.1 peptidylprolyl isomerase [Streptomyces durbertensis]